MKKTCRVDGCLSVEFCYLGICESHHGSMCHDPENPVEYLSDEEVEAAIRSSKRAKP